mgnify:CR=1 FL=1
MRTINQTIMNRVFEVTDAIPLSREAIQIPLGMVEEGSIKEISPGRYEVTLPDTDDLQPFLDSLKEKIGMSG